MTTEITTLLELWAVQDNREADYIQLNDIDLAVTWPENSPDPYDPGVSYEAGDLAVNANDDVICFVGTDPADPEDWLILWEVGIGWQWDFPNLSFEGHYDGNWKQVKNIYINEPSTSWGTYNGLFPRLSKRDGIVEKLGVVGCHVEGHQNTGAITGTCSSGCVRYCYATGYVSAGSSNHGGLIGEIRGWSGEPANSIHDCWSACTVESDSHSVGGFIGRSDPQYADMTIIRCYNRGLFTYTGTSSLYGPFFGRIRGTISETIDECYFDKETTGYDSDVGADGKTTAEMKRHATYNNWDLDQIWGIHPEINDGYPVLRGFHPGVEFPAANSPPAGRFGRTSRGFNRCGRFN